MRILLVDDSLTMKRIEINQLTAMGYNDVLLATDGLDGLDKLEKNMPVDLVLLDINMPVMDGMTALRKIRGNPLYQKVRIVMVTSESEKGKVLEALRAGANDYIVKPFDPEDFKNRIKV